MARKPTTMTHKKRNQDSHGSNQSVRMTRMMIMEKILVTPNPGTVRPYQITNTVINKALHNEGRVVCSLRPAMIN